MVRMAMRALDAVNARYGRGTQWPLATGITRPWAIQLHPKLVLCLGDITVAPRGPRFCGHLRRGTAGRVAGAREAACGKELVGHAPPSLARPKRHASVWRRRRAACSARLHSRPPRRRLRLSRGGADIVQHPNIAVQEPRRPSRCSAFLTLTGHPPCCR